MFAQVACSKRPRALRARLEHLSSRCMTCADAAQPLAGIRLKLGVGAVVGRFHGRLSGGLRTARGCQPHAPLTVDAARRRSKDLH